MRDFRSRTPQWSHVPISNSTGPNFVDLKFVDVWLFGNWLVLAPLPVSIGQHQLPTLFRDPHCIRAAGAYVDWSKPGVSPIPRHPLSPGLSQRLSCVDPKRVSAWGLFFRSSWGASLQTTPDADVGRMADAECAEVPLAATLSRFIGNSATLRWWGDYSDSRNVRSPLPWPQTRVATDVLLSRSSVQSWKGFTALLRIPCVDSPTGLKPRPRCGMKACSSWWACFSGSW